MLYEVTEWGGYVSANTRPHQLHWGDWEMWTANLCKKMVGLNHMACRSCPLKIIPSIMIMCVCAEASEVLEVLPHELGYYTCNEELNGAEKC